MNEGRPYSDAMFWLIGYMCDGEKKGFFVPLRFYMEQVEQSRKNFNDSILVLHRCRLHHNTQIMGFFAGWELSTL